MEHTVMENNLEQQNKKNTMEQITIKNKLEITTTTNNMDQTEQTLETKNSTVFITNRTTNNYYKINKETRKMQCLTCEKILIGVKPHNMKRHYNKMHDIDLQIGHKRKLPTIKPKQTSVVRNIKMRKIYQRKLMELQYCKKYKKHKEIRKTECLVCGKQLSGLCNSIIKRHFQLVHNVKLDLKMRKSNESDEDTITSEEEVNSVECLNSSTTVSPSTRPVNMDRNKFLKLCLALVAVKGVSVSLFDDEEVFKKLIAPHEKKFCTNLNATDVSTLMQSSSSTIRDVIRNKVKNKIISLILDLATGLYENVLNISINYIDNYNVHYNTLAIIQLDKATTDLKDVVLNCLANYEISKNQVYCYIAEVTNNAKQDKAHNEDAGDFTANKFRNNIYNTDNIFNTISTEFREIKSISSIIQLTVANVLSSIEFELNKYRGLVKELQSMLVEQRHSLILDYTTNWISSYKMFKSLLDNRTYLEKELPMNMKMLENQTNWNFIIDIVSVLTPIVKLNNQLYNEQYIFGDFYRDWLNCEIELEELLPNSWYARFFVQSMQKYKLELLKDEAYLSAIYLDPRFNFSNSVMLSYEQKHNAEAHLIKLYKTIHTNLQPEILPIVVNDSEHHTQVLTQTVQNVSESPPSILTTIKCEAETLLRTSYDTECNNMLPPTIKQEDFEENTLTSTTTAYESTEIVTPAAIKYEAHEPTTSNQVYDKLTQRIINLYAKPTTGFDDSLQKFKQQIIGLLSHKTMLQLSGKVLQYWMTTNRDADISEILQATFAVPVSQVTIGRAARCLDEGAIDHDLLLTKYNFQEINDASVQF